MKYINLTFLAFAIIAAFTFSSCVDNDFDRPEATLGISEELVVSVETVLEALGTSNTTFTDSIYVKGVVTADDESGNFYKLLTFQDETGALSVSVDQNELNAAYPEGNTVYVYLKGLTIARDAGTPKLGFGVIDGRLERIPDGLVSKFLVPGGPATEVEPTLITIDEFASDPDKFLNKLIKLENVEFSLGEVGQTYATAEGTNGDPVTENRTILNCDGDNIILRNSGYATFVNEVIPKENGTLIAIASKFNDDLQLFIRDTDDVIFTGERCDGSGGGQTGDEITIGSIKESFYASGADKVQEGFITGVVISDKNSGQVNDQNVIIQNGTDGILVRFTAAHSFNLGDKVQVTVTGQELSEFRSVLQIANVPLFNAVNNGAGTLPTPRQLTVAEILGNNNDYESTRVMIPGAMLSGSTTYNGNVEVNDGTGSVNIFTFSTTSYANDPVPSGEVNVIAFVSQFNEDVQLVLNNSTDVSGGTVTPVETLFNDDFENGLGKWTAVSVNGDEAWEIVEFGNPGNCAKMSGYDGSSSQENEDWLISGAIDATDVTSLTLTFDNANNYSGNNLELLVSTDYNGQGNPSDATWTEFSFEKTAGDSWDYVTSGNIDLSAYVGGEFTVAFKYTSGSSASKTWEIDNLIVKGEN